MDIKGLKGLFFRGDVYPQVIVSDRDFALMNAISVIFPETTNILCRFHINKNVKAKCKMFREAWDIVMNAWDVVVDYHKCDTYDEIVKGFESVCSSWPLFVDYVKKTWLIPHKEKFVRAWTDRAMHLGNTTSNRYIS